MYHLQQYPCGHIKAHKKSLRGIAFLCACGEAHYIDWQQRPVRHWLLLLFQLLVQKLFQRQRFKKPAGKSESVKKQPGSVERPFQLEPEDYEARITRYPSPAPVQRAGGEQQASSEPLKATMNMLVQQSWKAGSRLSSHAYFLLPGELMHLNISDAAAAMLRHAMKVAPGFEVPFLAPHVIYGQTDINAAGSFEVDEDGWVTIRLDQRFSMNKQASLAILAHELCHYILGSAGIRKDDTLENERMTDVCMFVLGFGDIFLQGYRQASARAFFKTSHQVGYLSNREYQMLSAHIKSLRQQSPAATGLPSKKQEMETRLLHIYFGNKTRMTENIGFYKRKYPAMSEEDILDKILWDWERDRR